MIKKSSLRDKTKKASGPLKEVKVSETKMRDNRKKGMLAFRDKFPFI